MDLDGISSYPHRNVRGIKLGLGCFSGVSLTMIG
jgi:hypothetical protein